MDVAHWGEAWVRNGVLQPFYVTDFNNAAARGYLPMLDWSTTVSGGGLNQPAFKLSNIANGAYDGYITAWAKSAKAWDKPLLLRLDWEMNGNWFVWSEANNGNAAGDYVRMWRHVHDLFAQAGAANVKWVWCPNPSSSVSTPLAGLYPGDGYTDYVCTDVYNFGTNPAAPNGWRTFPQVFDAMYVELGRIAPTKPLIIAEMGVSESGGSKADWLAEMFALLPSRYPNVKALLWFNWDIAGEDWGIESSSASLDAFKRGLGTLP